MELSFNEIEENDIERVREEVGDIYRRHIKRFYSEEGDAAMMEFLDKDNMLARKAKGGKLFLISDEDGEWIGYLEFDKANLYLFFILDEFRGKGYGRMAINWLKDYFREHKLNKNVQTEVTPNAYHAYEKLGFEPVSGEQDQEGRVIKKMKLKAY